MGVNQFNDRTWIHSVLRHFIVIPNELTAGQMFRGYRERAPKIVLQGDHLVDGELRRVATTSLVVHLLQIRAAYKKALLFAESSASP